MFLPNPKREYTLPKTIDQVRSAISKIPEMEKYKYALENDDRLLNQIRLHEKGVAWDGGYHIDFILTKISDTETKVEVEVGKKRGAINDSSDASNVNYIMKEITDKMSAYLSGNVNAETGQANVAENVGCTSIIIFFLAAGALLYFLI
jgi:hypothetical protein